MFSFKIASSEDFSQSLFFKIIVSYNYDKAFFSFYDIFFYTQEAFVFHLLVDLCIVHDHIVAYFFIYKDFHIFQELSYVVFLYYFDIFRNL